jgi:phage replication O-like protein O
MAKPQLENGYTQIANETMEALAGIRISGEARQCLDVIFRKTYGFHKKRDFIALSQFCLLSKMPKPLVCRGLHKLEQMNIIIIKKDNGNISLYEFNKDFSTWIPLSKKIILSKKIMGVIKKDKQVLSKKIHTKETLTKDTFTKDIKRESTPFEKMGKFIRTVKERNEDYDRFIENFKNKTNLDISVIVLEIDKFISYWTELNKSGTKQKWELESTFEIERRLRTWFLNFNKFNKNSNFNKPLGAIIS